MTPLGIPTRKLSFCLSLFALLALFFAAPTFAHSQGLAFAPVIYGVTSVNSAGAATIMKTPSAIATDVFGNVYIADTFADIVRKVDPTGTATIFAGSGSYGNTGDNGPAVAAAMTPPMALATDLAGNVYISDSQNFSVRKVDKAAIGTTSPIQRLTLVNSRQTELSVNSVTFSGDFHLAANPNPSPQPCYANVDLQASQNGWCTIDAVFTPTAEGGYDNFSITTVASVSAVSEPSSLALLGGGLMAGLGAFKRYARRAQP